VRVLGIETSSRRATVALVERGRTVVALEHEEPGGHAAHLLALVERAFGEAGWDRSSIDRVGVGVGPGSFTGIRVGVALAQGIGLGLDRPVLGVGSLRAMCRAAPDDAPGVRFAFLDARRNEVFCGEYGPGAVEVRGPSPIPRADVAAWLAAAMGSGLAVGEIAATLDLPVAVVRSPLTDLPHGVGVAVLAAELAPEAAPPEPRYVRAADAIRPNLPRYPLSSAKPT
jgi:tRNA threonylcarbamoyladenosine biosynthesis protein TsaB